MLPKHVVLDCPSLSLSSPRTSSITSMTSMSTHRQLFGPPSTRVILVLLFTFLLFVIIYLLSTIDINPWDPPPVPPLPDIQRPAQHDDELSRPDTSTISSPPYRQGKVHLFVPVNEQGARRHNGKDFCRTMQGAIVNGYEPIIYNWDITDRIMLEKVHGETNHTLLYLVSRY